MELPPSSKYVARRDESVNESERESLSKRLAAEFEAGRLTQDEYMKALDDLYAAKTMGELVPVAKKVPDTVSDTPPIVATGSGKPGELAPISASNMKPVVMAASAIATILAVLVIVAILL